MSYLILGLILAGTVILAAPISLGYNSGEQRLRVKWLGLTMTKPLGVEKPKKPRKIPAKKNKVSGRRMMGRLWQRRELALELIGKVKRVVFGVYRTLDFRDSEAALSLPDPLWNGLLYAVVTNLPLHNVSLSVNFENRNYAKIRVTVYPYRVARKLAAFFLTLPYIRLLRLAWDLKRP
ncbi:MAG: hypothetical protein WC443_11370 [Desulfobaccales bacterium]